MNEMRTEATPNWRQWVSLVGAVCWSPGFSRLKPGLQHETDPPPNRLVPGMLLCVAAWLGLPAAGFAQGLGRPTVSDSKVGYIDRAIPGDLIQFRFDSSYGNNRPTRAEFFYAQSAPGGPGLPLPEPAVNYQDFTLHAEYACLPRLSVFVEAGTRLLDPIVNDNTGGFQDMNAGFKWAVLNDQRGVVAIQFRTFIPTGDADRGLGTNHVSLEPALLVFKPLSDRLGLEGELRYWIPIGGTDFAGDVIRYGMGLSYDLFGFRGCRVAPVAEFVGWTVLGGKSAAAVRGGQTLVEEAAGQTIVNAKLGARVGLVERGDLYIGYGRALTGQRWYDDTLRAELRIFY